MTEPAMSGTPDATNGLIGPPITLDDKINYLYLASIRIEEKVDWCVQTVTAATTALGNMPFGGALARKIGANNG